MGNHVLLTGISGFVGLHCAKQLVEAGFTVTGSVRNTSKISSVKETLVKANVDVEKINFVTLDLNTDDGWDTAVSGCDYVLHVASPFVLAEPKDPNSMIKPAVDGTLRALNAAKRGKVKRIVVTSSVVSMMGSMKTGRFDEDSWTDVNEPNVNVYIKSKTLAEQAAWKFIQAQPQTDDALEMVSINPGGVFGPPLGHDLTGQSMTMMDQMLKGKMPMVPNVAFPMVDVRDVAALHVKALTTVEAAGQRLIAASSKAQSMVSVAQILKDAGYKGPSTRIAPNFLIRLMALFDREAKGMVGMLDMNVQTDNAKTRAILDWKPMPFKQSILDTASSIQAIS